MFKDGGPSSPCTDGGQYLFPNLPSEVGTSQSPVPNRVWGQPRANMSFVTISNIADAVTIVNTVLIV